MKNNWTAKAVRAVTAVLPVDKGRRGGCVACGACCLLPTPCPFLRKHNGTSRCAVYAVRPPACRKYPRTHREWLTRATCGFYFKEESE